MTGRSKRGESPAQPNRRRYSVGSSDMAAGSSPRSFSEVPTPNSERYDEDTQDMDQAELDKGFFGGQPNSPVLKPENSSQNHRSGKDRSSPAGAIRASAVPSSFYRSSNMSNTSLNSTSAFIDHRNQPHSLSKSPTQATNALHRYKNAQQPHSSGLRAEVGPAEMDLSKSTGTIGPSDPSPADPNEFALDVDHDEEENVIDHRPSPQPFHITTTGEQMHGSPYGSMRSDMLSPRAEGNTFTPSLSRQPSLLGQAEEDVCFPMLPESARPASVHSSRSKTNTESHDHEQGRHHEHHHRQRHSGTAGMLHHYPHAFDFDTLEEFAEKEREATGYFLPRPSFKDNTRAPGSVSFSPDAGGVRRRKGEEDGAPQKHGRMGRMRKLSESVATPGARGGRYQRKLALFEGAAAASDPPPRLADPPAHQKTPLLDGERPKGFGSSAHYSRPTPSHDEKERPYRFSFYSNALPSTIHARSLAELPGEGQTFESLFVGNPDEDPPAPQYHQPENGLPPHMDASTGYNTPSNGSARNSMAGGARPSGLAASAPGTKARATVLRSDADAELNTWWLDVLCPTDQEMKVISKVFGIHPLTTEDILMEESREKIELFRNYYLVCFRSFDQDPYSPTYLEPLNMYVVVFREGTLSFHFRGTPHPQNVRRRIKQLKDFINVTSDWISYALIDDITDAFGPLIQNIEYEVDSIDELVLILKEAEQSDMLRRIGTCRKKVMGLLRLMGNKADVVKGLAKRCNENWTVAPKSDIGLYLSDIQDHLVTMTQNLNHYEKILSRSHSNYLAQISIEMTDANNAINEVLSKLTALGTVLVPMNLITGLWGMNVQVPGQNVENLRWFFSIVAVLIAIAVTGGWATWKAMRR